MQNADELAQENEALRERLSRLSEASLRINESLDLDYGAAGSAGLRPVADRRPLRGAHPARRFGREYGTSSPPA